MISIALAAYNGAKYISEQLDSILSQNYQDFELIICDDCSTDNTWQIIEEYARKDNRIKIYENNENLGFKKNFEKAISLCNGEYIALSDQDDIWTNNHLDVLLKNINEKSASTGNALIIDKDGVEQNYTLSEGDCYNIDGNEIDKLYTILCNRNPFFGAISIFRKDFFNIAMPIPDSVKYHDAWFAAVACCLNGLNYTFEPLLKHRVHGMNETGNHQNNLSNKISNAFKQKARYAQYNQKKNMCDALITQIPNMSLEIKGTINLIREYYKNSFRNNRLATISFIRKHYKQIYSTNSYKNVLIRCIKIILLG